MPAPPSNAESIVAEPAPDERELVRRAASGDEDAFRRLVRRLYPQLRRWALARTGDPDEADEVVQRTLVRMHRSLPEFAGDARLTSWLYRILANAAIDLGRSRTLRLEQGEELARDAADGESPDPIRRLHSDRMAAVVREFFQALPEGQRVVLEMVDHEGMRPAEVADALDMKPVTVRAHLFKARRALRSRILERYPELKEGYEA